MTERGQDDLEQQVAELITHHQSQSEELQQRLADAAKNEREIVERARTAYKRASDILSQYGKPKTEMMGRGAGGGIIGYRIQPTTHHETPPITLKIGEENVEINLVEKISARPGYGVGRDGLSIVYTREGTPGTFPGTLATLTEREAFGWLDPTKNYVNIPDAKLTTDEEFTRLNQLLDFLETSYQQL